MAQYEYEIIDFEGDSESFRTFLNDKGKVSWELVTTIPLTDKMMRLIFIRRKPIIS